MASEHVVEGRKMAGFLRIHMMHQGPEMGMCSCDGWCLVGIDQGCSKFTSLIDAECGVKELLLFFREGAAPFAGGF